MKNVEEMMKDLKATERFVSETSVILNKLCDWKLAQTISDNPPTKDVNAHWGRKKMCI